MLGAGERKDVGQEEAREPLEVLRRLLLENNLDGIVAEGMEREGQEICAHREGEGADVLAMMRARRAAGAR